MPACWPIAKIGARVVRHARYAIFQMAEVAVPRELFEKILRLIDGLRPRPAPEHRAGAVRCLITMGGVCLNDEEKGQMDGPRVVLDIGHGGSAGKTVSAAHGFLEAEC